MISTSSVIRGTSFTGAVAVGASLARLTYSTVLCMRKGETASAKNNQRRRRTQRAYFAQR